MAKCTYTIILTNGETIEVSQEGISLQDFSGNTEIEKFIENKEKINALLYNFKKFNNLDKLTGEDLDKAKFYTNLYIKEKNVTFIEDANDFKNQVITWEESKLYDRIVSLNNELDNTILKLSEVLSIDKKTLKSIILNSQNTESLNNVINNLIHKTNYEKLLKNEAFKNSQNLNKKINTKSTKGLETLVSLSETLKNSVNYKSVFELNRELSLSAEISKESALFGTYLNLKDIWKHINNLGSKDNPISVVELKGAKWGLSSEILSDSLVIVNSNNLFASYLTLVKLLARKISIKNDLLVSYLTSLGLEGDNIWEGKIGENGEYIEPKIHEVLTKKNLSKINLLFKNIIETAAPGDVKLVAIHNKFIKNLQSSRIKFENLFSQNVESSNLQESKESEVELRALSTNRDKYYQPKITQEVDSNLINKLVKENALVLITNKSGYPEYNLVYGTIDGKLKVKVPGKLNLMSLVEIPKEISYKLPEKNIQEYPNNLSFVAPSYTHELVFSNQQAHVYNIKNLVKLGDVVTFGKDAQFTGTVLGLYGNYMMVVEEGKENLLNSISTKTYKIDYKSVRKLKTSILSTNNTITREIGKDLLKPGDLITFKNSPTKYLVIDVSEEGVYFSSLEQTKEILGTGVAKLESINTVHRVSELAKFPKVDIENIYDNSISKLDYSITDDLTKAEEKDFVHNGEEFLQVLDNNNGTLTTINSSGIIETINSGLLVTKRDITDISGWLTKLNSLALSISKTDKYPDSFYAKKNSIQIEDDVLIKGSVTDTQENLKDPIEVFGKKDKKRWLRNFDISLFQINNFNEFTKENKLKLLKPGFFYNLKRSDGNRSGKLWQIKEIKGRNYRVAYSAYNLLGKKITLERTINEDTLLDQIAEAYISQNNVQLNNTLKTITTPKKKSSLISTSGIEGELKKLNELFNIKTQIISKDESKTKAFLKDGIIYYREDAVFENILHEFLHILLAVYKGGDVESYFKLLSDYVKLSEDKDITSFLSSESSLEEEIVNELVGVVQIALKEGEVGTDWESVIKIAFNTLNGNPVTDPVDIDGEMFSFNDNYNTIISESVGFKSWLDKQLKEGSIKINCK